VDIIKHDYEITVRLKNIKDNINYTLKHNLANKVIIVAGNKQGKVQDQGGKGTGKIR
jgi:hypothetical protein